MFSSKVENGPCKLIIAIVAASAVAKGQGETAADVTEVELLNGPGVIFGGVECSIEGVALPKAATDHSHAVAVEEFKKRSCLKMCQRFKREGCQVLFAWPYGPKKLSHDFP
jgi:hypothetical protein